MKDALARNGWTRRKFIERAGSGLAGVAAAGAALGPGRRLWADEVQELPFENGQRPLVQYPQKRPLLRLTARPPQLETPFSVFNEGVITPNDAFFVRYHLSELPTEIDGDAFRVEIKGKINTPAKFSIAELKSQFEPVELVAVN